MLKYLRSWTLEANFWDSNICEILATTYLSILIFIFLIGKVDVMMVLFTLYGYD